MEHILKVLAAMSKGAGYGRKGCQLTVKDRDNMNEAMVGRKVATFITLAIWEEPKM